MYVNSNVLTTLQLYSEANDRAIAKTVGPRLFKSRYGYIEILHDEGIFDQLVGESSVSPATPFCATRVILSVTWAVARQRSQERAALFNLIHVLLIDVLMMTLLEVLVWSKNHD